MIAPILGFFVVMFWLVFLGKVTAVAMFWVGVFIGLLFGYAFRSAIASEISKFKVSSIAATLENAAKSEESKLRADVANLAAELKKAL